MDDFSDLAARIGTSVGELRGVLILSRDGLVLGAFPDETISKPAWVKFASMGDPEKAFVEFGNELWAYVRRGPYAAFAVSGVNVRPGLLLEQLEQAILVAEEARSKREGLRVPEAAVQAPTGKPRTTLHPEPQQTEKVEEPVIVHADTATEAVAAAPEVASVPAAETAAPAPEAASPPPPAAKPAPPASDEDDSSGEGEVDRVLLAQEFSRLLQETGSHDEETP
jgi:hypothetical protein